MRAIINSFDLNENDLLLDPFCGSGTALVEARLLGVPAIGIEISPLSAMISRVKSGFPIDTTEIEKKISEMQLFYRQRWMSFLDGRDIENIPFHDLIAREGNSIPEFPNYEKWFTKEAFLGTSIIVEFILKIKNTYNSEFIATALSSKMRSIGNVDVDVVRAEYRRTPRENVDVLKIVTGQLKKMVKSIGQMKSSHKSTIGDCDLVSVIEGSCLSSKIEPESVSAIITSPPYGVESLSYLRTHLLSFRSLEPLLGVDPYNIGDDVIGSEYLDSKDIDSDSLVVMKRSNTCREFFSMLRKKEEMGSQKKRIQMMMKFFEDMCELVEKFALWLKPGGNIAFVIGNKKLGDFLIPTDKIVTEIFDSYGMKCNGCIAHKLETNNSNSKVPWQDRIIENEFVIFYKKEPKNK